jgi:ABC-type microcin C transport system duplicated ATPase subunit YejF
MATNALLRVDDLSVDVVKGGLTTPVLSNISFTLHPSQVLGVIGEAGSGKICLNGPAARLGLVGDQIIILSYGMMEPQEVKTYKMKIVHLDEHNKIKK